MDASSAGLLQWQPHHWLPILGAQKPQPSSGSRDPAFRPMTHDVSSAPLATAQPSDFLACQGQPLKASEPGSAVSLHGFAERWRPGCDPPPPPPPPPFRAGSVSVRCRFHNGRPVAERRDRVTQLLTNLSVGTGMKLRDFTFNLHTLAHTVKPAKHSIGDRGLSERGTRDDAVLRQLCDQTKSNRGSGVFLIPHAEGWGRSAVPRRAPPRREDSVRKHRLVR